MNSRAIITALFGAPSGRLWIQLLRYLLSGGAAFLVDTGILSLLTELAGEELLLLWTGIGFCAGLATTYLLSILWVFDNRSMKNRIAEISIFVLIGAVGLLLTEAFMWLFARHMGLHYLLSKVVTTVLVFVWNFVAKKSILFREHET